MRFFWLFFFCVWGGLFLIFAHFLCRILLHADINLIIDKQLINSQTHELPSASWSGHMCELLVSHIWQQHWYVLHSFIP